MGAKATDPWQLRGGLASASLSYQGSLTPANPTPRRERARPAESRAQTLSAIEPRKQVKPVDEQEPTTPALWIERRLANLEEGREA